MENKLSPKKIFSTARTEYIKWICNPRLILMGIVLIFLNSYVIEPLQAHAKQLDSVLNALEPFLGTINSEVMVIIIPSIFLALMADFPKTDGNTLFFLQRIGKINWLLGQILFSIFAIFTYVGVVFFGTVLPVISSSYWYNGWSPVITRFAKQFPKQAGSFGCLLIRNNVYNQISPWDAALLGYAFMILYLLTLTLIMLAFNCFRTKVFGMLASGSVIAFGGTLCLTKMPLMWMFPMAHASIWFHFTKYYRKEVMPVMTSLLYFIILMIVLIYCSFRALKATNFDSLQDID